MQQRLKEEPSQVGAVAVKGKDEVTPLSVLYLLNFLLQVHEPAAMATHVPPPPDVLRSQQKLQTGPPGQAGQDGTRGLMESTNDAFASNGGEWQAVDYWYNRVLDKSSPSANTANPSALGLIAFGYTTALLQVFHTACICAYCSSSRYSFDIMHPGCYALSCKH